MNAKKPKLAQRKAKAESGKDRHGKNEDNTLKDSRHKHHRGSPMGKQAAHPLDAIILQVASGARNADFSHIFNHLWRSGYQRFFFRNTLTCSMGYNSSDIQNGPKLQPNFGKNETFCKALG
jgi:hypothetical protein